MNTVLFTIYNRPELFHFTVESLLQARGAHRYKYIVGAEYGYSPEYIPLLKRLQNELGVEVVVNLAQKKLGFTPNTLESLKMAENLADEYTIVLDDDLVVSRDYFECIDTMFRQFYRDDVIVLHCRTGRRKKEDPEPPADHVLLATDYQHPGVCIPKEQFIRYILPHCHPGYYEHKLAYLWKQFPNNTWGANAPDSDGLTCRIIEKHQLFTLKPAAGRVQHIGFYGLHRTAKSDEFSRLSYQEKIQSLEPIIWDSKHLESMSQEDWGDYWFVEQDHSWDRLKLVNPEFNPYQKISQPNSV